MSQWLRPGMPWFHGALIALTIQGMTPDPATVTSGSLARILRCILDEQPWTAADAFPLGDDATDEVCTPAIDADGPAREGLDHPSDGRHRLALRRPAPSPDHSRLDVPRRPATACRCLAGLGRFTC